MQRYLRGDFPERNKMEGAESFSRTETHVVEVQLKTAWSVRGGTTSLFATTLYERTMLTLALGAIRARRWTCSCDISIASTLRMSFFPIFELVTFITRATVNPFSWGLPSSRKTDRAFPAATWSITVPSGIFLTSMVFSPAFLVAYISRMMTLEPGDLILTGTPAGVAALSPGDVVEVSIEKIGILKNRVAS